MWNVVCRMSGNLKKYKSKKRKYTPHIRHTIFHIHTITSTKPSRYPARYLPGNIPCTPLPCSPQHPLSPPPPWKHPEHPIAVEWLSEAVNQQCKPGGRSETFRSGPRGAAGWKG